MCYRRLFYSPQALWGLGNIAGDCDEMRRMMLAAGVIPAVCRAFVPPLPLKVLRNMTWLISNLSTGPFDATPDALLPVVPTLARVLHAKDFTDAEILTDTFVTLRRCAASAGERAILAFAGAGILLRTAQLVSSPILAVKVRFALSVTITRQSPTCMHPWLFAEERPHLAGKD